MDSNVLVIMFVLKGCPHCHAQYPHFVKIARKYINKVPAWVLDADDSKYQELADRYQITATPTTLVLKKPAGFYKVEGEMSGDEIEQLFARAATHA